MATKWVVTDDFSKTLVFGGLISFETWYVYGKLWGKQYWKQSLKDWKLNKKHILSFFQIFFRICNEITAANKMNIAYIWISIHFLKEQPLGFFRI